MARDFTHCFPLCTPSSTRRFIVSLSPGISIISITIFPIRSAFVLVIDDAGISHRSSSFRETARYSRSSTFRLARTRFVNAKVRDVTGGKRVVVVSTSTGSRVIYKLEKLRKSHSAGFARGTLANCPVSRAFLQLILLPALLDYFPNVFGVIRPIDIQTSTNTLAIVRSQTRGLCCNAYIPSPCSPLARKFLFVSLALQREEFPERDGKMSRFLFRKFIRSIGDRLDFNGSKGIKRDRDFL